MESSTIKYTQLSEKLPPVGWNLSTAPTFRGGRGPRPVSTSFGKSHPTRSSISLGIVFGNSPQRVGMSASIISGKHPELVGLSTKHYDQHGSIGQCSRLGASRHRGKVNTPFGGWQKRDGYGQKPAYLISKEQLSEARSEHQLTATASHNAWAEQRAERLESTYTMEAIYVRVPFHPTVIPLSLCSLIARANSLRYAYTLDALAFATALPRSPTISRSCHVYAACAPLATLLPPLAGLLPPPPAADAPPTEGREEARPTWPKVLWPW